VAKTIPINYTSLFSIGEVANILKVDKELVSKWTLHFSDYLNPKANPEKGTRREYTAYDLYTLGFISMYWEDDPDLENIKYGLNSEDQFETPFSDIVIEATPIFKEFSDELLGGKTWLIGGMADFHDKMSLANSYKMAGDALVDIGMDDEENVNFIYPAIYNYRHATELFLKAVLSIDNSQKPQKGKTHNLQLLYKDFKDLLSKRFYAIPPKWFENIILAFDDFDPNGTTFRYGVMISKDEMIVDLLHIKKLMGWFTESCQIIKKKLSEI
jgi:DNA-binding transcriptional MerR regulator